MGVLLMAPMLRAEVTIRDPGTFVVDTANLIDDGVQRGMEGWLKELEDKTGAQVKVLTVRTTGDETIEQFSLRHAHDLWKLGQQGKDNGVLITVAVEDREYRIEVGYGLEGQLPDAWCDRLGRDMLVPAFRQGRFGEGLLNATVAVANRVADEYNVRLTGAPNLRYHPSPGPGAPICGGSGLTLFFIIFVILMQLGRRNRGYRRWGAGDLLTGMVIGSMFGGRRGGGGWGGGGFGGGSFGGGGGFGGGGASGRW